MAGRPVGMVLDRRQLLLGGMAAAALVAAGCQPAAGAWSDGTFWRDGTGWVP